MDPIFFFAALSMVLLAALFVFYPLRMMKGEGKGTGKTLSIGFAVAVALSAIALYAALGRPPATAHAGTASAISRQADPAPAAVHKADSVSSLLGGLQQRLEREPGDGKGWLLLARSYRHLGRPQEAEEAYRKAAALGITNTDFEAKLAAGQAAPPAASVHGVIRLAGGLRSRVGEDDVVFVMATAADGNRMPLAVIRRRAADLPFEFVLDDSQSMTAGRSLADADSIIVSAKVSRSGDALDTATDLIAKSGPLQPAPNARVDLILGSGIAESGHPDIGGEDPDETRGRNLRP